MTNDIGWGKAVNNDIGWGAYPDNSIGAGSVYTVSEFAETLGIKDSPSGFVISVKTDNVGTSNNDQFTIPVLTAGSPTYNYDVDWGDGNTSEAVTGATTHTYSAASTYDITITGTFAGIGFNNGGDKLKLLDIKSWGNIEWESFATSFRGCNNLTTFSATDVPDLSNVTSFSTCFTSCKVLNADFTGWDTSNATTFTSMFFDCDSLEGDGIDGWTMSQATELSSFGANDVIFTTTNYDALLIAWDAQGAMSFSGTVDFGNSKYTSGGAAETARTSLISKWGAITDGGAA